MFSAAGKACTYLLDEMEFHFWFNLVTGFLTLIHF